MSILTICFHAVKRSMRMSDGLSSCGAVFFLICSGSARGRATIQRYTRRGCCCEVDGCACNETCRSAGIRADVGAADAVADASAAAATTSAAPPHLFPSRPPHLDLGPPIGSSARQTTQATRPYPLTNDWFLDSVEPAFESVRDTVSNRDILADVCGACRCAKGVTEDQRSDLASADG
jgi:hypothetical protein